MANENNDEQPIEKNVHPPLNNKKNGTLLSKSEIRGIVKNFVKSWTYGTVKIIFPTAQDIIGNVKFGGNYVDNKTAMKQEVDGKLGFIGLIEICAGGKPATEEQLEKAVSELYNSILRYRAGNRIEGTILDNKIDDRLCRMERGFNIMNNLVRQLVELHRSEIHDGNM